MANLIRNELAADFFQILLSNFTFQKGKKALSRQTTMSHIRKVNTDPVSNLMNMLQYKAPGLGNRPDNLCRWFFKKNLPCPFSSSSVQRHPPNPFLDFLSFCRRPPKACTHRFQPASKWLQPQVALPPHHHQASLTLRRASSILPSSSILHPPILLPYIS